MRQTQRRGAVGGFELLIIFVVLIGGILLAAYATEKFGWLGFIGGGLLGGILSFSGVFILLYICAFVEAIAFGGIPYLPTCGNGKCKSGLLTECGDYEWELNSERREYFRCKCGRLYWRNMKDGRVLGVLEVLDDGTMKPYRVWRSFRGWYPDHRRNDNDIKPTANI